LEKKNLVLSCFEIRIPTIEKKIKLSWEELMQFYTDLCIFMPKAKDIMEKTKDI
jgi:hypothetical protein